MKYYVADFTISCKKEVKDIAKELFVESAGEAGFESFEETEHGIKGYVQIELLNRKILDENIQRFILPDVSITYTLSFIEDRNWNEEWEKKGFDPITIGNNIIIYDAKHGKIVNNEKITIGIDTEQAFGTGNHETTRMIISALLKMDLKGKRVLDCGCGTGVLSITALKLGALQTVAYDVDEWSVKNCLHNVRLNNVKNVQVIHGAAHVLTHMSSTFDIILANINRNILLVDLPIFNEVLSEQGIIILSGFYKEDISLLSAKAEELGLSKMKELSDGDWACIVLTNK